MKIIMVHGNAGSGKDTFYEYILDLGLNCFIDNAVERLSFADRLKRLFSLVFEIPLNNLYDRNTKELYRKQLISFAENARKIDDKVWMKDAIKELENNHNTNKIFIITDFRHKNEFTEIYNLFINKYEIITIKIDDGKESENETDGLLKDFHFHLIIENKGSLQEYYKNIGKTMNGLI